MQSRTLDDTRYSRSSSAKGLVDEEVSFIHLEDGRKLAFLEFGERTGYPLFYCHSHGSSRLEGAFFHNEAKTAGFRVISVDRPGIGYSDFSPRSDQLSFAADIIQIANKLRVQHFGLLASGGGAGFALAVAHQFPDRARILLGLSCVPSAPANTSSTVPSVLRKGCLKLLGSLAGLRHSLCAKRPRRYLERLTDTLSYADRRVLENPDIMANVTRNIEESLRQGSRGVAHDVSLHYQHWNFDLRNIRVPIHLWQGSADTLVSPRRVEEFAAGLQDCAIHKVVNRGHFFFYRCMGEVFQIANVGLQRSRKPTTTRGSAAKKTLPALSCAVS